MPTREISGVGFRVSVRMLGFGVRPASPRASASRAATSRAAATSSSATCREMKPSSHKVPIPYGSRFLLRKLLRTKNVLQVHYGPFYNMREKLNYDLRSIQSFFETNALQPPVPPPHPPLQPAVNWSHYPSYTCILGYIY